MMKNFYKLSVVLWATAFLLFGSLKSTAQDTSYSEFNYIVNSMPTVEQCILTPFMIGGVQTDEYYVAEPWKVAVTPGDSMVMWTMTALQWGWPNFGPKPTLDKYYSGSMYQRLTGLPEGTYVFRVPSNANYIGTDLDIGFYCYTSDNSDSTYLEVLADDVPSYTNRNLPFMHVKADGKATIGFYAKTYGGTGGMDIYDPKVLLVTISGGSGVQSALETKTSVYTRNGQLTVKFSDGLINGVDIYNVTGQLVSSAKTVKSNSFNTILKEKGMLFVKVYTDQGSITKKVVN